MTANIDNLLALPKAERRKIAEKLWESLSPAGSVTNEEKDIITLLEQRWQNLKSGNSKQYTPDEMKQMITEYRNKK